MVNFSLKKTQLIIFASAFIFFNCNKSSSTKWVYFDATLCADKWGASSNNEEIKQNVSTYFSKKNIKVYDTEILADGVAQNCTDCACKSGQRIKLKVKKGDLTAIKAEGFYE